eukprot:CAMPEP_0177727662 /NCGR_PEP_ID=MMETSP0484_2-20121128/20445_1 /TAXON_ID=354590 /ORGANISM="Rhodomonas lens, Strain RHODO" /LENGTH=603 /DNA_ID=CAMNT_0019240339 /DNA_START=48 /DNA_END=1859 /DNA_ORIENTATION=-
MQTPYDTIFAATPGTTRGQATVLSVDAKGEKLLYGSGRSVVIRSIADPLKAELYSEHAKEVTVAKMSPSGFYVASGDMSGLVKIWSYDNPEHPVKFEGQVFAGAVCDLQWSPDSQKIVAVGDGRGCFGRVFTFDTGSSVGEISGHSKKVLTCDYKQTKPLQVCSGSEDFQVNLFNGPPFQFTSSIKGHTKFVNCTRYSPDGTRLCTVGSDMKCFVFDSASGDKVGELVGHKGTVYACCWSADGTKIATASADKTVMLWDASSFACLGTTQFAAKPAAEDMQVGLAWAGSTLISLSLRGELSYIDASNPAAPSKVIRGHNKQVNCLALGASGIVVAASYDGLINRYQVGSAESKRQEGKGHGNSVVDMAVVGSELLTCGLDDTLRRTGLEMMEVAPDAVTLGGQPLGMAVVPGGQALVVATSKGLVLVKKEGAGWKAAGPAVEPKGWAATSVSVSPSGEVAVGGDDSKVHLFALNGPALSDTGATLEAHPKPVTKVMYSPDGSKLASTDAGKEVIVWDLASKSPIGRDMVFHNARLTAVDWSPDSKRIVTGSIDNHVIVWEVGNVKNRVFLDRAHIGGVTAVKFLEENKVVTTGADSNIKVWVV